jgi:hypothetical protein
MRRLTAALLVVLVMLFLGAAPVFAKSASPLNRRISGPFEGTTFFDLSTSRCNLLHQVFDGSYAPVQGRSGSFHIDVCPSLGADGGNVDSGTFTMHDPMGATLEGTVTGVYDTSESGTIPFEFVLHIDSGTKVFHDAHGTITVTGVWVFEANPAPISGTLAGALSRG